MNVQGLCFLTSSAASTLPRLLSRRFNPGQRMWVKWNQEHWLHSDFAEETST